MLAAMALAVPTHSAANASSAASRTCGPPTALTVFEGSKVRLYVVGARRDLDPKKMFSVGGDSQLYGCLLGAERSWRLDRRFRYFTAGFYWPGWINLRAPWVALEQMTVFHIDTGRRDLIVVNLRTGKSYTCPTSETLEGQVSDVVITNGGRVGWLGETISRDTLPRWRRVPAVALCGPDGATLIEYSSGIELGSLRLVGPMLQWINAGELKSYPL